MMDEGFVVEDGCSRFGLRRLHVLGAGCVDRGVLVGRVEGEGGVLEAELAWVDEAGMGHLYGVWRYGMVSYPMYVVAMVGGGGTTGGGMGLGEAVGWGSVRYHERYGEWPNRAVVREGTVGPGVVTLARPEGEELKVEIERVGWMRAGDVGVYLDLDHDLLD